MTSFEYNGATITLKNPTGRDRMKLGYLRRLSGYWAVEDEMEQYTINEALNMLYLVESVTGNIGFDIPYKNPTEQSLKAFIDGVLSADEDLYLTWVDALLTARQGSQGDGDLLPSHEVPEKKVLTLNKSDEDSA